MKRVTLVPYSKWWTHKDEQKIGCRSQVDGDLVNLLHRSVDREEEGRHASFTNVDIFA